MRWRPPPAPPTVNFVRLSLIPARRLIPASSSVIAAPVSTSHNALRPFTLADTSKSLMDWRLIGISPYPRTRRKSPRPPGGVPRSSAPRGFQAKSCSPGAVDHKGKRLEHVGPDDAVELPGVLARAPRR